MKRNFWKIIGLILLFLVSTAFTYVFRLYQRVYIPKTIASTKSGVTLTPTPTPDPYAPRNILLLGYGGPGHDGGALTDTIIIAHLIPRDNAAVLISIPRDLWVPIPLRGDEIEYKKINHAFAIGLDDRNFPNKKEEFKGLSGGGEMVKQVVGSATGLPISGYIAVDFAGFRKIVNILGGVKVNVPYSFTDEFYPIKGLEDDICGKTPEDVEAVTATMSGELLDREFMCRYETLNFSKGLHVLDSDTALKFVRSRHSNVNGNDFGRSMRQQAFIVGIKDKLLSFSGLTKIIQIGNELSNNVMTDINIKEASDLAKGMEFTDITIKSLSINTDNALKETVSTDRQYILVPIEGEGNFESLHKYIKIEINNLVSDHETL